LPVRDRD